MITFLRTLCLLVWLGAGSFLSAQNDKVSIDFSADIKPILESNCLSCHNEENAEGGYRIDNRDDAMDYIEEGDASSSDFYLYLISDDEDELMPPPDEGGPLDDSDIKLIKEWIDEGAQWPTSVSLQEPAKMDDQEDDPDAPFKGDAAGSRQWQADGSVRNRIVASGNAAHADWIVDGGGVVFVIEYSRQFCDERLCLLLSVVGNTQLDRRLFDRLVVYDGPVSQRSHHD